MVDELGYSQKEAEFVVMGWHQERYRGLKKEPQPFRKKVFGIFFSR